MFTHKKYIFTLVKTNQGICQILKTNSASFGYDTQLDLYKEAIDTLQWPLRFVFNATDALKHQGILKLKCCTLWLGWFSYDAVYLLETKAAETIEPASLHKPSQLNDIYGSAVEIVGEGFCGELTRRLALAISGQRPETQVHVAGEGVAGTEVGAARRWRRAGPGRGASDLTTRAAAEREGAVANRPVCKQQILLNDDQHKPPSKVRDLTSPLFPDRTIFFIHVIFLRGVNRI